MGTQRENQETNRPGFRALGNGLLALLLLAGCATTPQLMIGESGRTYPAHTIIDTAGGRVISFDELLSALRKVEIVYVGERHTDPAHHEVQLKILRALAEQAPGPAVGMEMFDRNYQQVLDLWSAGELDEASFLRRTHWYANWKYDYALYREILAFVREKRLPLVGLNLPFHLPAKVAVGGIDSLTDEERRLLAVDIDTGIEAHRAYVEEIFNAHRFRGRDDFESFYAAQCAWEDTMAESVAGGPPDRPMVVLAGNGHIMRKFGIPQRAYKRSGRRFATVYPVRAGKTVEMDYADFLWVTP